MIARSSFRAAGPSERQAVAGRLIEAGVFAVEMELAEYVRRHPWGVQLDGRWPEETHAVLDVWREGTGVGIIRLFKARARHQRPFLAHLLRVLDSEGFREALSPGLVSTATRPFKKAGFAECERLLVLKKHTPLYRPRKPTCELRPIGDDDVTDVVSIDGACFDDLWRFSAGDVRRVLAGVSGFVAVQNGASIGYTMVSTAREAGTVGRLAVRPEFRNRGVGSTLLAAGLDWLREAGAKEVTLCTQRDNMQSRRLYRRFGFEQLPDELWIMQKDL